MFLMNDKLQFTFRDKHISEGMGTVASQEFSLFSMSALFSPRVKRFAG